MKGEASELIILDDRDIQVQSGKISPKVGDKRKSDHRVASADAFAAALVFSKKDNEREKAKRKRDWDAHYEIFNAQLRDEGLKIFEVGEDGNCYFRAMSIQCEGDESNHYKYRCHARDRILADPDQFEDNIRILHDKTIAEYISDAPGCLMSRDGTHWADELDCSAVA